MIDKLKRSREPLAWVAIGLVVLGIAVAGWRLVTDFSKMSAFAAFQEVGNGWLNETLAFAVVALVMTCSFVAPPVGRARLITQTAAIVLSVGVLLTLASVLMGMWASAGGLGVVLDLLGGLLQVAFKAVLAGATWVLLRALKAGRAEFAASVLDQEVAAEADPETDPETDAQAGPESDGDEVRAPGAGAVWWSAAEAAAGAPARDRMPEDADQGDADEPRIDTDPAEIAETPTN